MKYSLAIITVICLVSVTFASNSDDKQTEEQYKIQRYEDIKKKKDKEYKKGVHNDDKKDYVNNWIGEDINYQKRVIKLKSDYRAWAEEKISRKEEVVFKDYEPLKALTRIEKQILLEYHNKLFYKAVKTIHAPSKNIDKKKNSWVAVKKPVDEMPDILKKAIDSQQENVSTAESADNKNDIIFLLSGITGLLFIAALSFLIIRKRHKKSQFEDK